MPVAKKYDLLVKNVRVVRPNKTLVQKADVAVKDGKFVKVGRDIAAEDARKVVDGKGLLAFPGLVDPHMHTGIYSPLAEDAVTESRAAAQGGVTSSITYFRTGQYYLNKGGAYADFYPEVLEISNGRFHVDYAYHLAPMDRGHMDEIPERISRHGVASFKIFMFYGSHGLHGASDAQREFLMIGKDVNTLTQGQISLKFDSGILEYNAVRDSLQSLKFVKYASEGRVIDTAPATTAVFRRK